MKTIHLFLLLTFSVFLSSCFNYDDIEIKEVRSVQLDGMKNERLNFSIDIELYNPNSFKVKVTKADLDVAINQLKLGHTVLEKDITIPPNESSIQHIELSAKVDKDFMSQVPSLVASALFSAIELNVKGDIKGKVFLLSRSIRVDHTEKVDLSKLLNN